MADKSTQLVLDALGRAVAEPAGLPLHGTRAAPGLFPAGAPGKQAARRCQDEGLLRLVETETRGKTVVERFAITDKGLAYLLRQASPRQVLEDLVRALEARRDQFGDLLDAARQAGDSLAALKASVEKVLEQLREPAAGGGPAGAPEWAGAVLESLAAWRQSRASEDCPLPELFHLVRPASPALTIGRFHDGLRLLHDREQIYLHPWTGPLYAIPEPPYALLVGHQVAYYASYRAA